MIFWIDAQLPPSLAPWITDTFQVKAYSVSYLGLREATDEQIFMAARQADAIVITKDTDFTYLLDRFGPPPRILWVTIGNTSKSNMKSIFEGQLLNIIDLFQKGEILVELV